MDMTAEARGPLGQASAGLQAEGLYKPVVVAGNMAYTSGHLHVCPTARSDKGGSAWTSRGRRLAAARRAGLAVLASLREALGSLDRVRRVIKVTGFVQCTPGFSSTRRSSTGAASYWPTCLAPTPGSAPGPRWPRTELPLDAAVEIEAIFEISRTGIPACQSK